MNAAPRRVPFLLAVLTLPWVGVGLVHALSGRDIGGGLQPSWVFLAVALMIGFPGVWDLLRQRTSNSPLFWLTFLPLAALLLSAIGFWWAPSGEPLVASAGRWLRQVIQWLIMMAFVWGAVIHHRQGGSLRLVLDFLFAGVFFQILYSAWMLLNFWHPSGLFQACETFFTSNPSILASSERLYVDNQLQAFPRLRGTVCEPLYLGNFLVAVWPLILVWRRPALLRLGLGILMALLLALTFSRGAWLGFLAQLPLLLFWLWRRTIKPDGAANWRILGGVLVAMLVLVLLGDFLSGGYFHLRLMASFNGQDWSNLTRLYSMQAAWRAFLLSPVFGIGWGQYAFHFPWLVDPLGLQSQFTWPVVNNFPLQILCETGLVGFLIAVGLALDMGRRALFSAAGRALPRNSLAGVSLLGLWGAGVQFLTFSQYNLPHIWFVLGLFVVALNGIPCGKEEVA